MQRKEKGQCLTLATRRGALGPCSAQLKEVRPWGTLATERELRFHQGKLSLFHSCFRASSGKEENTRVLTLVWFLRESCQVELAPWLHDESVKSRVVRNDIRPLQTFIKVGDIGVQKWPVLDVALEPCLWTLVL